MLPYFITMKPNLFADWSMGVRALPIENSRGGNI